MGERYLSVWYTEEYTPSGALVGWGRAWSPNYWAVLPGNTSVLIVPTVETAALGGSLVRPHTATRSGAGL